MSRPTGGLAWVAYAARHHKRWVAGLLVLGLGLGAAVSIAHRPIVTAEASVLLPSSALGTNGQPTRDMKTQVEIATSDDVLTKAGASMRPPMSARDVSRHVSAQAASEDVLVIRASAMTAASAIKVANAVAASYVALSTATASGEANSVRSALSSQVTQLTNQIQQLENEIGAGNALLAQLPPGSPESAHESSIIAGLQTQETDAAAQLNNVNNQIDAAKLGDVLTGVGTRVLDPATVGTKPSFARSGVVVLLAGAVALIAGCVIALLLERGDRRLRLRDEIADAVGVPVIASLNTPKGAGAREIKGLLRHPEPSSIDAWSLRRAMHYLGIGELEKQHRLAVVSLPGDPGALLVGPIIARFAASIHIRTDLVLATRESVAAPLWSAVHSLGSTSPSLTVLDSDDASAHSDADLVMSVVVQPPGDPVRQAHPADAVVIAVSANGATADQLAELAMSATDAQQVVGIIVVNPAEDDTTTGRFPQATRTATISPRRVTGTTRDSA